MSGLEYKYLISGFLLYPSLVYFIYVNTGPNLRPDKIKKYLSYIRIFYIRVTLYVYIYIYIYIRGEFNKFPDFLYKYVKLL